MAISQLGSGGDVVRRIQVKLQALGLYRGPIDGLFGGGTESAVKQFQRANGLGIDGQVGPRTWQALFPDASAPPPSEMAGKPVEYRCVALTGAFETGAGVPDCFAGVTGDFDDQGLSVGVCQWNFGQGSLQPLLSEMLSRHPDVVRDVFHDHSDVLAAAVRSSREDAVAFARTIQDPLRHSVNEPWRGMFKALGRTQEFEDIQVRSAAQFLDGARALCREFGLISERAVALMFDIVVQNGSISPVVKARIMKDFTAIDATLPEPDREVARMRAVANRRADAASPLWAEDVRARKLCIANGTGRVHGIDYDLESQFGLGLAACV